jgi:hypothetical protein
MPIEASVPGGSAGFSTKEVTRPSVSVPRIPIRVASSRETFKVAIVTSAACSMWNRSSGS